jgi:NAD(P)-dependent dehydrogenase (short-subunit alcohol dehydrogenase family)
MRRSDQNLAQRKICLITGATAGIGKATALGLAKAGMRVVIAGRNRETMQSTTNEINNVVQDNRASWLHVDLCSQKSIRTLAADFEHAYGQLDVLINNAGVFVTQLQFTVDGIEMQFAVNHLSYFLLTNLTLPVMTSTARIINVASRGHRYGHIHLDDPGLERSYDGLAAYAQSKLANIMFTYELSRRLQGTGITVNCLHPGSIKTEIGSRNSSGLYHWVWKHNPFLKSIEQGARTPIYLATSPEVDGVTGTYFANCKAVRSSMHSHDIAMAQKLWEMSEEMTSMSGVPQPRQFAHT